MEKPSALHSTLRGFAERAPSEGAPLKEESACGGRLKISAIVWPKRWRQFD